MYIGFDVLADELREGSDMATKALDDLPALPEPWPLGPEQYERFRELRTLTPLVRGPLGLTLALRAQDVELLVSDATRQVETEAKMLQGIFDGPIFDFIAQVMLFSNGETHQRRRRPIARTFAHKLMESMRPRVASIASNLIEAHLGRGHFDFADEVAAEIPALVIADILGIPRSDLAKLRGWVIDASAAIGFFDLQHRPQIEQSLIAFNAYVDALLSDRRVNSRHDFLSEYVAATAAAGDLTEGEIRAQIVGLILAGSDTTRNSMCMILYHLLRHPDQWTAFCASPDGLKRAAVEEGLRFEPVVTSIPRVALKDLEIDGYLVPQGAVIAISTLSVLRDPSLYANPEDFNIHRTDHARWSFAFGAGAHRCAGEALARIELEETLAAIARKAPSVQIVGSPPYLAPGAIRTVRTMGVALA